MSNYKNNKSVGGVYTLEIKNPDKLYFTSDT